MKQKIAIKYTNETNKANLTKNPRTKFMGNYMKITYTTDSIET